jgi:outer membrane lipoprotein carrier protein
MRRMMLTIVILLCIVSSGHAGSISPLEGVEALRRAFSDITDFSAEITQEKRFSLMKRTMTMNGKVRFRKPDLFYLEISSPYASRMLLRDSTIEQAMGNSNVRNKIVLPPEQGLKQWFSKLSSPITSLPEGLTVQADLNNSVYTLTILPSGKGQVKDVSIIFLKDGTIRRLIINEQNGDRATMILKKLRRNVGLTAQDFSLE